MDRSLARYLWQLYEPVHATVYFAPEVGSAYAETGLIGGWMAYFASRSAAMGPVGAGVVSATFFNFHPRRVARAIPDAWRLSTPEKVLSARLSLADLALRRILGEQDLTRAEELARAAVERCEGAGRPLFSAHAGLNPPGPPAGPHLGLWHWATCLREHRGDGHVACLVAEGLDGCEAHVLQAAAGVVTGEMQRSFRGWSEGDWAAAEARLQERGLLGDDGELSAAGAELRARIEDRTDELALAPWAALGAERTDEFVRLLEPVARAVLDLQTITFPNPMGLTAPMKPTGLEPQRSSS